MKNYEILLCEEYLVPIPYKKGDINKDGIINIDDGMLLDEYLNAPRDLTDEEKDLMDINKDGLVNSNDSSELLKVTAGITSSTDSNVSRQELRVRFVAEIGSSSSTFSGKAIDPIFYTKIDGTHELTFELPKYYFDENTGEKVFNELTDLLVNKCKILLRFPDEGEDYYLVINERADEEKDGQFKYTYSCNDAFIEELSKTGYGLVFDDDVEGNGLADIHQLAGEILKDTDWSYDREQTGFMGEYRTEVNYNTTQERYDTVQIPHPVHPIKYIPELERYCYVVDSNYKPTDDIDTVYCYEDTEQVTSNTVQNILYNTRDFVSDDGWLKGSNTTSFMPHREVEGEGENATAKYYLHIPKNSNESVLINATAVDSNKTIKANKPYLFHVEYDSILENNIDRGISAGITHIEIYDQNPVLENGEEPPTPKYSLGFEGNLIGSWENSSGTKYGRYIVIKTQESIKNPYISLKVNSSNEPVNIESIQLFELKTMSVEDGISDEETYYDMLRKTPNGTKIDIGEDCTPWIYYDGASSHEEYKVCFPADVISAQTIRRTLFFYLEEGTNTPIYINFNDLKNTPTVSEVEELPVIGEDSIVLDTIRGLNLTYYGLDKVEVSKEVYKLKGVDKYYQYYQLTKDGQVGGAWDLALLGNGLADKRRTLIAEKSNRFNLLQELAELFKTWCIFETKIGENNELQKRVYFRENVINSNFSGFHAGVNLKSLERKVESDEIVTKMYIEDVESDFANDGFVTIRTSSLNPWGENYYYNFKYYGEQKLLSKEDVEKLEFDKEQLYSAVKGKNIEIYELNDKIINAKLEIKNLTYQIESLNYGIAAAMERIASIDADIANYEISQPDKEQLAKNKQDNENRRNEYETELKRATEARAKIEEEYNAWTGRVEYLQGQKETLIKNFENIYAQFIKEGVWSDSTYSDNDTYFLDSQKVSLTSAMPKMSWNISAIDGSVLQELEDFKIKVGDQTILIDNEFFPSKEAKEHVFEVLISGIKEHLDDGTKNEIEIRNYLTRFEDLFQRISAATQTLELNEQTYNRAANFTADGHIDQSLLERSLLENASILANSSDNSYKLDQTGLHLQSLINPVKKLRIVADGIVLSDSLDEKGNEKWTTGISADGINADKITTGSLDTSLIRIFSDSQPSFIWNSLGISAYKKQEVKNTRIKKIGVVGDSYSIHRSDTVEINEIKTSCSIPGWIECLRDLGYTTVGGNNTVADSGPYGGKGASGFLPYYHLEQDDTSNSSGRAYYFKTQLEQIVNSREWPEEIIIAGGFNDKNMCANDLDGNLNYAVSKTEGVAGIYGNNWSTQTSTVTINKQSVTINLFTEMDGHVVVNAVQQGTTASGETVQYKGGNTWKSYADGSNLKQEIIACQNYLKEAYEANEKNPPKVYLVFLGRYSSNVSKYESLINNVMLANVKEIYRSAAEENEWKYFDLTGSNGWYSDLSISHTTDHVHPTEEGNRAIAKKLSEIFDPNRYSEVGKSDYFNVTISDLNTAEDGGSFIRLDKHGIYSINNNKVDFHYDANTGLPWFKGLGTDAALSRIIEKSTFSLTDKGFNLNIGGSKGKVTLGYLPLEDNIYGLRITDPGTGKAVVNLTNDASNCTIAGWKLTPTSLRNAIPHPKDPTKELVTYLCTGSIPGATAFAMGEKPKNENDYGSCAFRVSAGGKLSATGADIAGKITAKEGNIGPLKITSKDKKLSGDSVKKAFILGEYYATHGGANWAEKLKNNIEDSIEGSEATVFTDTFAGFSTGSNKVVLPTFAPLKALEDCVWVREKEDNSGNISYTYRKAVLSGGSVTWEEKASSQIFPLNKKIIFYNPLDKKLYYKPSWGDWSTITLTRENLSSTWDDAFSYASNEHRGIVTMKTDYNLKTPPKIYFPTTKRNYYYKKDKDTDGGIIYKRYALNDKDTPVEGAEVSTLPDEHVTNHAPFDQNKIYYNSYVGRFIDYVPSTITVKLKTTSGGTTTTVNKTVTIYRWKTFLPKDFVLNERNKNKEIITIENTTKIPSSVDNTQAGSPMEDVIWSEKINGTSGYWWYDLDSNDWKWGSITSALQGAGLKDTVYQLGSSYYKYDTSNREWKEFSTLPTNTRFTKEIEEDVANLFGETDFGKYGGYYEGTEDYLFFNFNDAEREDSSTLLNTNPYEKIEIIPRLQTDEGGNKIPAYKLFFDKVVEKDNSITEKYFYLSTKPINKCLYFYYDNEKTVASGKEYEKWTYFYSGDTSKFIKKINNFSSLLPDEIERWRNITHVYVGGAWNDRTYNQVLQGTLLIEEGLKDFLTKIENKAKEIGNKITVSIFYLPRARGVNDSNANKEFQNVVALYKTTIKNNSYPHLNIVCKNASFKETGNNAEKNQEIWWEKIPQQAIYKDENSSLPSSTAAERIASLMFAPPKTYQAGFVYGKTLDSDGNRYSAGMSLWSTAPGSIALWAGYKSKDYDTPFEERDAGSSAWEEHTNFYVTYNGIVHAPGLKIGNGSSVGGWVIEGESLKYEHRNEDNEVIYKFFLHAGPEEENKYWLYASRREGTKLVDKFSLTKDGKLWATDADITGRITATSGKFTDNVTIGSYDLTAKTLGEIIQKANISSNNSIGYIEATGGTIGRIKIDEETGDLFGPGVISSEYGELYPPSLQIPTRIALVPEITAYVLRGTTEYTYKGPALQLSSYALREGFWTNTTTNLFIFGDHLYSQHTGVDGYSKVKDLFTLDN